MGLGSPPCRVLGPSRSVLRDGRVSSRGLCVYRPPVADRRLPSPEAPPVTSVQRRQVHLETPARRTPCLPGGVEVDFDPQSPSGPSPPAPPTGPVRPSPPTPPHRPRHGE